MNLYPQTATVGVPGTDYRFTAEPAAPRVVRKSEPQQTASERTGPPRSRERNALVTALILTLGNLVLGGALAFNVVNSLQMPTLF